MLGYVVLAAFIVGSWFAIKHFKRPQTTPERFVLSDNAAKWLKVGLYVLVALVVLSALGVCPGVNEQSGLDPLLNRPPR